MTHSPFPSIRALTAITVVACVLISGLRAEDHTRIIVLKMPSKGTAAVRAMLNETTKRAKPETMDAVLKLQGVSVMADFKQANPWISKPIQLSKPIGEIELGGVQALELGVNVRLEGIKDEDFVEEMLTWEMDLPTGGKSYQSLQNIGNRILVTSGRWQERASFVNSKDAWMLWQFSTMDSKKAADVDNESKAAMFVEMHWFQSSESDLASLTQSKPETREKAFLWLGTRAKLSRECSFWIKPGGESGWSANEGKFDLEGKEPVAKEERFSIFGKISGTNDSPKIDWEMRTTRKGKEVTKKLVSSAAPGVWEFIAIEGVPDANVLACRISRD